MHHRSFDKQRIEWKGEIEDMRIIVSFCRVHLDLESQKPWHDKVEGSVIKVLC